jgi:tetratricopeptide (TPR) repeat protein
MKWSLLLGNFWGTEIRLHLSMLLIVPYALFTFQPEDLTGALLLLGMIAAIFLCVALHELGHTVAARLFGIQVTSIMLWPLGGFANLSRRPEKVLPDVIISAAGPLANLLIFAGLLLLTAVERLIVTTQVFPEAASFLWNARLFPILFGLMMANLALALFNLVPVYPLDGGQIARGLLKLIFGERNADTIMLVFSLPLALALTVLGVYLKDIIIILTGLLLILAASSLSPNLYSRLMTWALFFLDRTSYHLRRGDFDSALRVMDRAIQRKPNRAGLYISRAIAYLNISEVQHAKADAERALSIDSNNHIAWTLLGEVLALEKQYQPAMQAFNQAIQLKPGFALAYLDRGNLYQEMGELNRALEDMNRAAELGQGSVIIYILRSILRSQMGDINGSNQDADKALRFAPRWMLSFPEVFLVNFKGHLRWALNYYMRAIQRMPAAYQAYQGRADACRVNDRLDWAIADYNRAIQLAPRDAQLYLSRGRCYLALGNSNDARADIRRALDLAKQSHLRRQAETLLREINPGAPGGPYAPASEPTGPAAQ